MTLLRLCHAVYLLQIWNVWMNSFFRFIFQNGLLTLLEKVLERVDDIDSDEATINPSAAPRRPVRISFSR